MHDLSDVQLLRDYAAHGNEAAFREIANRHAALVYSSALRQVTSPDLARDVAQSIFTDLARKAPALARALTENSSLIGWLYRSTRFTALNQLRDDRRRLARERHVMQHFDPASETAPDWDQVQPVLDEAMADLSDEDRDALLLRYFKNHDFRAIGSTLGVSDDAAQKRVSRAVERLREFFAKRGVNVGAGGLAVVISANAVQAAPAGLAVSISAAALAGAAATTSTLITATTKTIAMTTLQKTLVTATVAVLAGAGIYEARQAAQLRDQVQTLQQQQAPLSKQVQQLQNERDKATNRLADLVAENSRLKSNPNQMELLKLRGEVTRLKQAENDPTQKTVKAIAGKINQLKQQLDQTPKWKIPELQFITEKDWAAAVWDADLETDDGVRAALSKVRETAINTFLNEMMKAAFKKYLAANNEVLPANLFDLKPYFNEPVSDAMLERYKLLQSGKPDNSADLVRLIANADDEYDSNHGMSINGAWGGRFNRVQSAVEAAATAFAGDHVGQMPTDPTQLVSYLATPIDQVTVKKYLTQILANPPSADMVALQPAVKAYSDANNGGMPKSPSDLLPYVTTPEQKAILQKAERDFPAAK